jgi:hypothetical protein
MIKSRSMRWAWHAASIDEESNAYSLLAKKPKRKRPLGKPIDNIRMCLRDIRLGGMD